MTVEECKIMCTHHSIDLREKLFFRIIYETQLRPFEVLNLQVKQWDRKQGLVTALKVKQKTKPRKTFIVNRISELDTYKYIFIR